MLTTVSTENLDFNKVWLMFQETDKKFKETDKKFQETDRIIRNLTKKMSESESRWGKFVESLVEGSLVRILNEFGITVNRTSTREKCLLDDEEYEIDIIAKNGDEIVAVEVKTTLSVSDVKDFIAKLELFKKAFPDYKNNKIFGAVAFIQKDSEADKFAAKSGLIVIKAVGESAKIANRKDFKPKNW